MDKSLPALRAAHERSTGDRKKLLVNKFCRKAFVEPMAEIMSSRSHIPHPPEASPAEPARRLYKRFMIVGGLLGVFCPFVYGAWLFAVAGDGTSAFGGCLIIVIGCPLASILFATIGAALGGLFDMIGFPSKRSKDIAATTVGTIAIFMACMAVAIQIHGKTRETAVRSYVLSVCDSVEQFQLKNGHYPAALTEIETTHLNDDCGIPLDALQYEVTDAQEYDVYGADFVVFYVLGRGYVARANVVSADVVSAYGGRHTASRSAEQTRTSLATEQADEPER